MGNFFAGDFNVDLAFKYVLMNIYIHWQVADITPVAFGDKSEHRDIKGFQPGEEVQRKVKFFIIWNIRQYMFRFDDVHACINGVCIHFAP